MAALPTPEQLQAGRASLGNVRAPAGLRGPGRAAPTAAQLEAGRASLRDAAGGPADAPADEDANTWAQGRAAAARAVVMRANRGRAAAPKKKGDFFEARGRLRGAVSANGTDQLEEAAAAASAAQEALFSVTMMSMDGSTWKLDVLPSQTGNALRSQVGEKLGVTNARIRLLFGPALLDRRATLAESGVAEGAVVNVVIVPPLYQGSQLYNNIVVGIVDSQTDQREGEEEVHESLAHVMDNKAKLNDAFVSQLRKIRA